MDLEKIREQKIKELQANQEEQEKMQEEVAALETNAKQFLDKDAVVRYGNLKSAFPEKSLQVVAVISQLAQQGQIKQKLNDEEFKEILRSLNPKKRDINIVRK